MGILELLIYHFREIFPRRWPDDPKERRRMKAFILGAGAGSASRPDSGGKIKIEIEKRNNS